MSTSVLFPVQVLREHVTNLEAALSVCLADPGHKPVHRLRTQTRRIEALLLLLPLIPGLPEHREEAAIVRRSLRKLRRAAGEVRDLDVHRQMLEELLTPQEADAEAGPSSPDEAEAEPDGTNLGAAADELRRHMGHERDKAALALQQTLKDRQAKAANAVEALLHVLKPAEELPLPGADLLRDAESVLERDGLLRRGKIAELDEDELHTVRKAAKAARYLAETLPEDPALVAAAARFEALQQAGGEWHDALELARASRQFFGKGHQLTASYREQRDRFLEIYRRALEERLARPHPKKAPAKRTPVKKAAKKRAQPAAGR